MIFSLFKIIYLKPLFGPSRRQRRKAKIKVCWLHP